MKPCPECEYPNPNERDVCFKCGTNLSIETALTEAEPVQQPAAPEPTVQFPSGTIDLGHDAVQWPVYVTVVALGLGGAIHLIVALRASAFANFLQTTESIAVVQTVTAICAFVGAATILVLIDLARRKIWAWIASIVISLYYVGVALVPLVALAGREDYQTLVDIFPRCSLMLILGVAGLCGILCSRSRSAILSRR